ncbi:MAG: succinate dehydrogenase assembly factor 2 [Pseudomonadota bacterium]|nr:succinate dehydrogenase assembly factor 2 [Pseudomonadota bacterium]
MQLSKLRWKCRKGIRELDILLTNYLENIFIKLNKEEKEVFVEFINIDSYEMFNIVFKNKPFNKKFLKIVKNLNLSSKSNRDEKS